MERAVRAQFGPGFRPFGDLRRRNELEYPRLPADTASEDEATQAIEVARQLITRQRCHSASCHSSPGSEGMAAALRSASTASSSAGGSAKLRVRSRTFGLRQKGILAPGDDFTSRSRICVR